jgi:hypothetical protein
VLHSEEGHVEHGEGDVGQFVGDPGGAPRAEVLVGAVQGVGRPLLPSSKGCPSSDRAMTTRWIWLVPS